jgi:hypothetical protein
VYASWNGATQVASWRVLGGSTRSGLHALVPAVRRAGFQTAVTVHAKPRYVAIEALDAHGRVLGISRPRVVG